MREQFKRRTVLVKKSLQIKVLALVFLSVLFAFLLIGGELYYTLARTVLLENPSLQDTFSKIHQVLLVKGLLYLGIIFLISLFISHRMAGPIYRFEQSARALAEGDLTHRVVLRTGDELLELQEEFNRMAQSLQDRVRQERQVLERLAQEMKKARASAPEAVSSSLEKIQADLEQVNRQFKI